MCKQSYRIQNVVNNMYTVFNNLKAVWDHNCQPFVYSHSHDLFLMIYQDWFDIPGRKPIQYNYELDANA